jgi:predicted membrane protein
MTIFLSLIFSLIIIYFIVNFKFKLIYKIILFLPFSLLSGFLTSIANEKEPGSFAVFVSSSLVTLIFLSILYPIFRNKFKNKNHEQIKDQNNIEISNNDKSNDIWNKKWKK